VTNVKDRPFVLIDVNVVGAGVEQLKEAMDKEKLPWRSFADSGRIGQGAIASKWNLSDTPTLYVIDYKGVIRYKWVGAPGAKAIDVALEKIIQEAEGLNQ
jgi:peroxiredoxin